MDLLSFWWSIIENESMRDSRNYEIYWSFGDRVIDNELWEFYEVEYIMLFGIMTIQFGLRDVILWYKVYWETWCIEKNWLLWAISQSCVVTH